jgi:Protein of unknown function (DUF 659)
VDNILSCKPFAQAMLSLDHADRPGWYIEDSAAKKMRSHSQGNLRASTCLIRHTSVRQYAVPNVTAPEQKRTEQELAMHFYITATFFSRVEEEHLLKAFRICRPDVVLPDRKKLGELLLQKCHSHVKSLVDKKLEKVQANFCITTDAASNINNEPVVNYMMIGDGLSLFLESVYTDQNGHTAQWLAQDVTRVIETVKCNVCGVVTDNSSSHKGAWALLQRDYPSMFFQGCASHAAHLLVKDIFGATKAKRGRQEAEYPEGYPFEYLLDFSQHCNDIVSFFSFHHQLKAKLREEQIKAILPSLTQPAATRWGSLLLCLRSLRLNESVLHVIVSAREFVPASGRQSESCCKIRDIITSNTFVNLLEKCIHILIPIDAAITVFQNDCTPISDIYRLFAIDLKSKFDNMACLSSEERSYILFRVRYRLEFICSDAMGMSYLLDPRYIGDGMDPEQRNTLEECIVSFPVQMQAVSSAKRHAVVETSVAATRSQISARIKNTYTMKERMFVQYTNFIIR